MTVTLRSAHTGLTAAVLRLRDTVRELELIAVSDQPPCGDVLLVDEVTDAALEVSGAAQQAAGATLPADSGAYVQAVGRTLVTDLAAPERLAELTALGQERPGEVGAWADEVIRCVHACQLALWTDTIPAFVTYWQEFAALNSPCSTSGARR